MSRRWAAGDSITIDGFLFRIVKGKKGPRDLRLDVLAGQQWRAVHMKLGAFLADFFYENEDERYPPKSKGGTQKGGQKYLDYCRDAAKRGWEPAEQTLEWEKRQKGIQGDLFTSDEGLDWDDDDDQLGGLA